ncbi:MAG TPA: AraC family transcriptional regulator [Epsilonproteobacteria bacterium]|nr:AraC family transcriptional regulator [Campylobacterota bacterium]
MKKGTENDYLQSVYRVVYYIEQHYSQDLNIEKLAKIAGFSKYHFHRIFLAIVGENISAFIRRVRLSASTGKLFNGRLVTEVAMQSGYETPASFAKAFKENFGLSPKAFSKQFYKEKEKSMLDVKIVYFEPTEVLCVRKVGDYMVSAGEAWESLMGFAYAQKIKEKKNLMGKEAMMFGIGYDDPNSIEAEKLRYDACISYDDKSVKPEGEVVAKTIEGGKYLYHLHKGSYEGLKDKYNQMTHYMIEHNLKMADRPVFEKYYNRDPRRTKPENLKTGIYIPIEE